MLSAPVNLDIGGPAEGAHESKTCVSGSRQESLHGSNGQEVEIPLVRPELHSHPEPERSIRGSRKPVGEGNKGMHLDREITIGSISNECSGHTRELAQEVPLLFRAADMLQDREGYGEVELVIVERQGAPVAESKAEARKVCLEQRAILNAAGTQTFRVRIPTFEEIVLGNRQVRRRPRIENPTAGRWVRELDDALVHATPSSEGDDRLEAMEHVTAIEIVDRLDVLQDQRRFMPRMLTKKLDMRVWKPSAVRVIPGTTRRMV